MLLRYACRSLTWNPGKNIVALGVTCTMLLLSSGKGCTCHGCISFANHRRYVQFDTNSDQLLARALAGDMVTAM